MNKKITYFLLLLFLHSNFITAIITPKSPTFMKTAFLEEQTNIITSPLIPGIYIVTSVVYLGTNPAPNGVLAPFDEFATLPPSLDCDLVGEFLDPNQINPITNYDCISNTVAQISALAVTDGIAPYTVAIAANIYSDSGLTTPYTNGDFLAFPNPPLFVEAGKVWQLVVSDANGCESSIAGTFETPQAKILGLSNHYSELDFAHIIYGDPNGSPFVGPITNPNDSQVNDLPAGFFASVPTGLITDYGNNSASFKPNALGYGQFSVRFGVGSDSDCSTVDQQFVNIYPSFSATFDGSKSANSNAFPTIICQGFNGGEITLEPDVLDDDIIPILLDVEDVFFVTPPPADGDIGAELTEVVVFDGPGVTTTDPTTGLAQFNTNMAPGAYTIILTVGYEQCVSTHAHSITIVDNADATTNDIELCKSNSGQINLTGAFTNETTSGGVFNFNVGDAGLFSAIGGNVLTYNPQSIPANGAITATVDYTVGNTELGGDCLTTSTFQVTINETCPE